jgi:hypothetical protein
MFNFFGTLISSWLSENTLQRRKYLPGRRNAPGYSFTAAIHRMARKSARKKTSQTRSSGEKMIDNRSLFGYI